VGASTGAAAARSKGPTTPPSRPQPPGPSSDPFGRSRE
jgi:hypothetical protein